MENAIGEDLIGGQACTSNVQPMIGQKEPASSAAVANQKLPDDASPTSDYGGSNLDHQNGVSNNSSRDLQSRTAHDLQSRLLDCRNHDAASDVNHVNESSQSSPYGYLNGPREERHIADDEIILPPVAIEEAKNEDVSIEISRGDDIPTPLDQGSPNEQQISVSDQEIKSNGGECAENQSEEVLDQNEGDSCEIAQQVVTVASEEENRKDIHESEHNDVNGKEEMQENDRGSRIRSEVDYSQVRLRPKTSSGPTEDFKRGSKACEDVWSALTVLKTHYRLSQVEVRKSVITFSSWNLQDLTVSPVDRTSVKQATEDENALAAIMAHITNREKEIDKLVSQMTREDQSKKALEKEKHRSEGGTAPPITVEPLVKIIVQDAATANVSSRVPPPRAAKSEKATLANEKQGQGEPIKDKKSISDKKGRRGFLQRMANSFRKRFRAKRA